MSEGQSRGPRDLRAELEGYDGTNSDSWKPDPGDILAGTLVRYEKANSVHGPKVVAIVDDISAGHRYAVWLSPKVLVSEFEKHRPKPGERIAIKRLLDHANGYKVFRLLVDRDVDEEFANFDPFSDPTPSSDGGMGGPPGNVPF